ncbi:MAG: serine/threonine protein kinase [Lentisphaeria bacterium]|nr:serine/threonine protein kinase [Lentisphaeria bacterium]
MDIMENNGQLQLEENTGTEELEQSLPGFDKTQYGKKIPVEIGEDDQAGGEGANETDNTPALKIFCYNCNRKLDVSSFPAFSVVECPFCQTSLIVPRWFDSYLLEEIVGEGGMATVYRALDLALDREVAIKIMAVSEETDADFHTLFLEEARTAATINHQAVVAVYTCAVAEGKPYIVMEFMGGGSLEKILEEKKEPLDILQVCQWMQDIADGLDRAAKYGIIHHDIKPANIMMNMDGQVKIGDFGIAQRRVDQAGTAAGAENSWGSPFYVSPEKARDGVESFPGDIYSLGAAFYHLLTGEPPFHGYGDIEELVYVRIEKDPPPPSSLRKEIPPEVDKLVLDMMQREPEKRPSYPQIIAQLSSIIKKYRSGINMPEAIPAAKAMALPPVANETGFFPAIKDMPAEEGAAKIAGTATAEDKKLKSPGNTALLIAGCVAGAMIVFIVLFIVFRAVFSSMKG